MKDIAIKIIIFIFTTGTINFSFAQNVSELKVDIGDKIPEDVVKIIEENGGEVGKPTIINFWATWCVPCIRELKTLNSILDETNEINVLSVTYEDEQKFSVLLESDSNFKSNNLTILSSDTLLIKYFPHRLIPHNIWVGEDGVVKYITGGKEITKKNIDLFIKGEELDVLFKKDALKFNMFEPLEVVDNDFIYRSVLTKRIPGAPSGLTFSKWGYADDKKFKRVFAFNSLLANMLWFAVDGGVHNANYYNTMRIETGDSLRFYPPKYAPLSFKRSDYKSEEDWRVENTHCFELTLPDYITDTLFFSYMLEDLKRNFLFEVEKMKDSIPCSVITCDKPNFQAPNPSDSTILVFDKNGLRAQNVSILYLFQYLNGRLKENLNDTPKDPPFIDKTGGMRISLTLDFKNGVPRYEDVKKLICERYGITITQQIDEYEITIIKDMS